MLKGASREVKAFADHVIAERGVRHGHVVMMPIEATAHTHGHTHSHGHGHGHTHSHAAKGGKK